MRSSSAIRGRTRSLAATPARATRPTPTRSAACFVCRLLRLGELKAVYQATDDDRAVFTTTAPSSRRPRRLHDDRAVFKAAVQHCSGGVLFEHIDMRKQQVALKQKIKSTFRRWGIPQVKGQRLYSTDGREVYLNRLSRPGIEARLRGLYQVLDAALAAQKLAKTQMLRLGQRYPEVQEFQKVSGAGPIGAHLFDGFIQTPHRLKTKQKLWRYCGLGIRSKTSDGKPLGYEEIDPSGRSELKAMSYRAWLAALRHPGNEVEAFFEASLWRTGDRTHARLNTQRKILATLLSLWKHQSAYKSTRFLGSA